MVKEKEIDLDKKHRREKLTILLLGALCLALTWVEFRLFGMSESLPFQHSIFFFGLVNFNIILFLLLMFLIFRNIVKNFADREGGPIGSSLKSKLIAAFVGFSFVPTALMFTISVFYINNSFDRWFNEKTSSVLKSSLEVTNSYYLTAKRRNYHFAGLVAQDLDVLASEAKIETQISQLRERYSLDAVEYYPDLFSDHFSSVDGELSISSLPIVSVELLKKGVQDKNETSTIHHFSGGDIVRVIVPVKRHFEAGAIVVSSFVPVSLISKMDDIASAYENFKDTDPLAYPIKSIYLIILVLMSLFILLGATWFGFYLARQLSIPLEKLMKGTQQVVKGDYREVEAVSGAPEINRLVSNFNQMTQFLERSERELTEHSRYIDLVLTRVSTGVISIDDQDQITMINRHAEKLIGIQASEFQGKKIQDILPAKYYKSFSELIKQMKDNKAESVERELTITLGGKSLLLEITVTMLFDEAGKELGKVLVFDDLSVIVSAQRAAAWTEVARRIAHEIKNPLTPISLAAQRLQRKFGTDIEDPAFKDCTDMIVEQVDGLKNLVNEFSQFARMPKISPVFTDLSESVESALQLYNQGERHFKLEFEADKDLPSFLFDPKLIERAVLNLVDNASESLLGVEDAKIRVSIQYDSAVKLARIVVEDNGPGIPQAARDRIFEPYMTTKRHGTGLGLAIVKRTVEDHNGYIRVFPREPHGCRFVIELPVTLSNTATSKVTPNNMESL